MQTRYDTIILGAGAAGLMAAAHLNCSKTLLIEGNDSAGAKLAITGGGRCNITHADSQATSFVSPDGFVASALNAFGPQEVIDWFDRYGVSTVQESGGQYFVVGGGARVVSALQKVADKVHTRFGCTIARVDATDSGFVVETSCGVFEGTCVIIATGGISFPRLGAGDIGHRIAQHFGHTVIPTSPALVGLTLQPREAFFKTLSGIAIPVVIEVGEYRIEGDWLFAHRGISGPAVLDASLYWKKGLLEVDFLPGFSLHRLHRSRKQIGTLLPLPRRAARAFLEHLGITNAPAYRLNAEAWEKLEGLHAYRFAPAGTFGYGRAEVTRGGVATEAVDPTTMESRLHPGLFFVGEVLDVTGRLGGHNLQWAFSSAVVAARSQKGSL